MWKIIVTRKNGILVTTQTVMFEETATDLMLSYINKGYCARVEAA